MAEKWVVLCVHGVGDSEPADLVDAHPRLAIDDIRAAYAYAAARLAEERILIDAE